MIKPFRVDVQGHGESAELALVRNGKVFAYVIPADRTNSTQRLEVADLYEPLTKLGDLARYMKSNKPAKYGVIQHREYFYVECAQGVIPVAHRSRYEAKTVAEVFNFNQRDPATVVLVSRGELDRKAVKPR